MVLSRGTAHRDELASEGQTAPVEAATACSKCKPWQPRGANSAEQAQQRETVEQLYNAIHQLPKTDAALVLLYLDELSYREMAEVLGISESNVGVKLNRAKKALSALMNGAMNPTMDPDKYQQAWQAHSSQTRVTVDADLLLKEVQRNQRDFRATIFRRDFVEVGVGLLMLPLWIYHGRHDCRLPWTWYLTVPAIIWVDRVHSGGSNAPPADAE